MFQALICSPSGGTVYKAIGIFCAYYVDWQLPTAVYTVPPDDEEKNPQNMYRLLIVIN
jgi:hypothetical protein